MLRDLSPLATRAYKIICGSEQAEEQWANGGWAQYELLVEEIKQRAGTIGLHVQKNPDWLRQFAILAKRGDLKGARRITVPPEGA